MTAATPETSGDRYVVISADCHAGAPMSTYREYLDAAWQGEFDVWAASFDNPFADLSGPDADRNWNSARRVSELEADGIVAEVVFPNTVPPFFPRSSLTAPPPSPDAYASRWAGLQAHNRWLADFCAEAPGRRAGIAQILLNNIDDAVAEIRWAHDHGLTGGVLLPGVPPGCGLPPLFAPDYEPIWQTCAELGTVVNHHSGSAVPDLGTYPASGAAFIVEITWFAHRALWHLLLGGVFERYPTLKFVLTEQGSGWVPATLETLDFYLSRFRSAHGTNEAMIAGAVTAAVPHAPSEYWKRNGYLGASFFRPRECALRHDIGVDRIMWGSDYPHTEGTYPFTREGLRHTFAPVDPVEVQTMLGRTAADVYGFDFDALAAVAKHCGPRVDEVAVPLDVMPVGATSPLFADEPLRPW